MTIQEAVSYMKKGYNVTRPKWQGYSIFISKSNTNNADLIYMTDHGDWCEPYNMLPEDILAKDWQIWLEKRY